MKSSITIREPYWNGAFDDDPGFATPAAGLPRMRAGACAGEGQRQAPDDAWLVAILGEHGFEEVPA